MKRQRKYNLILFLIILVAGIGLGYAALSANLEIDGTTNLTKTTWDIHFDHIQETSGGITPSSPTSINAAGDTVTYSITLSIPGDFYEFTVDAVNAGTVDGMVESVTSTLNGGSISSLPDCLTYSATYSDGIPIAADHLLAANSTETYKVRVEFKTDIDEDDLPDSNQTLSFAFSVNYVQANSNAVAIDHSFGSHSWETIINNVRLGNISTYSVGDTKTVDIGELGTHTLRIANMSTPTECQETDFSKTACGFVLEFVDIITTNIMNLSNTNVGGWPASEMRMYVNTDIYNALPEELRNAIINTTVVSGHGLTAGETNFTSIDKLYLLSAKEVGFDESYDSATTETRILDYYDVNNTDVARIKQYNDFNAQWWLRTPNSGVTKNFRLIFLDGSGYYGYASTTAGVSPAFRIG